MRALTTSGGLRLMRGHSGSFGVRGTLADEQAVNTLFILPSGRSCNNFTKQKTEPMLAVVPTGVGLDGRKQEECCVTRALS
jgi:hypothetical protein